MFSELPLFIFTLLGGCAAGLYVVAAIFPAKAERKWVLPLTALILLAIGGVALLFHLGRPELMLYAFNNPSSGIAKEGYCTVAFGVLLVIDLILAFAKKQIQAVRIVAAVCGLALAICMGWAYMDYTTVATWGSWTTMLLFVCTALGLGASLYPVIDKGALEGSALGITVVLLEALACVACAITAVHFATVGASPAMLIVGALCAAGAAALSFMAAKKEKANFWAIAFVIMVIAIAVARLGFYLG